MKRFLLVLVFLASCTFAHTKTNKIYSFTYENNIYGLAIAESRSCIKFENYKFQTLNSHKSFFDTWNLSEVRKDFETDYIVIWNNVVYVFESERFYYYFISAFDTMINHTNDPLILKTYQIVCDELILNIHTGDAGRWNILGEYSNNVFKCNKNILRK